jgi:hypothetical protein
MTSDIIYAVTGIVLLSCYVSENLYKVFVRGLSPLRVLGLN